MNEGDEIHLLLFCKNGTILNNRIDFSINKR